MLQLSFVQDPGGFPHRPGMPAAPHISAPGQPPHATVPPQPSPISPQNLPPGGLQSAVVSRVHEPPGGIAQTPGMPPAPHIMPVGQSPHSSVPPQPSPILPQ